MVIINELHVKDQQYHSLQIGDVNGDGLNDLLISGYDERRFGLYFDILISDRIKSVCEGDCTSNFCFGIGSSLYVNEIDLLQK